MKNLDWAKVANYLSFCGDRARLPRAVPRLERRGEQGVRRLPDPVPDQRWRGRTRADRDGARRPRRPERTAQPVELERHIQTLTEALGGDVTQTTKAPPRLGRGEVLAGATSFHTGDCKIAQGRDVEVISRREAQQRGLEPCRVCNP